MVLEYFVWLRYESSKSIGSPKRIEQLWKGGYFLKSHAKIDSGDAKNIADEYTKITIFIIWEALENRCMQIRLINLISLLFEL